MPSEAILVIGSDLQSRDLLTRGVNSTQEFIARQWHGLDALLRYKENGSTLTYKNGATNTLATEFMLAYGYGTPQVYAGFDFTTGDDSPSITPVLSAAQLAKLGGDTYGKCESCGEPIGEARLEAMPPPGHEARIDLSITDDWPLAQAFVIISAVNAGKP